MLCLNCIHQFKKYIYIYLKKPKQNPVKIQEVKKNPT